MPEKNVADVILDLLISKAIDVEDAGKYLKNYRHFQANETTIRAQNLGDWVASLNGEIYVAPSIGGLLQVIGGEPHHERAFVMLIERNA